MNSQIVLTLIGAALSGLAVMAFKYPQVYKKTCLRILFVFLAAYILVVVWSVAITICLDVLTPFIESKNIASAKKAISGYQPDVVLVMVSPFIFMIYIFILEWFAGHVLASSATPSKD